MDFKKISIRAIKEWYILRTIGVILYLFIILAVTLGIEMNTAAIIADVGDVKWLYFIRLLVYLFIYVPFVLILIHAYIFPRLQYRNYKFRVTNEIIEIHSGVVFTHVRLIPFVRLQHIEVYRGITDRIFKMSTVRIFTAGSVVIIPNLELNDADELMKHLNNLVKLLEKEEKND